MPAHEGPEENLVDPEKSNELAAACVTSASVPAGHGRYIVGEAQVDPSVNTIAVGTNSVLVEPRVMAVLACLVRRAGETVSRGDLLEVGWGERDASDESLTETVSRLRRAFGDRASAPRYIRTVPKKGYRLIAQVNSLIEPQRQVAPDMSSTLGTLADSAGASAQVAAGTRQLSAEPVSASAGFRSRAASARRYGRVDLVLAAAASAAFAIVGMKAVDLADSDRVMIAELGAPAATNPDPNPAWLDIDPDF